MVTARRTPEANRDYYQSHLAERLVYNQAHREEQLAYQRSYGRAHRQERQMKKTDKRQRLNELKVDMGCCVCGYNTNPAALAFHHTDGNKTIAIANAVARGWGWERIVTELEQCDVICHNCHAIKHWGK